MKMLAALAAAGFMMAAPFSGAASAAPIMSDATEQTITLSPGTQLAQVNVRIGDPRPGYRRGHRMNRPHMHRRDRVCTTRTMWRNGRRVTVRNCR